MVWLRLGIPLFVSQIAWALMNTSQCGDHCPVSGTSFLTRVNQKSRLQSESPKELLRADLSEMKAHVADNGLSATVQFNYGKKDYKYELARFSVYADDYVEERHTSKGVFMGSKPKYSPTFKARRDGQWASVWIDQGGSVSGFFEVEGHLMHVLPSTSMSLVERGSVQSQTHTIKKVSLPRMKEKLVLGEGPEGPVADIAGPETHWSDTLDNAPDRSLGPNAVGAFDPSWNGTRWFPNCYPGDWQTHVLKVGLAIDVTAHLRYGDELTEKIEHVMFETSIVYENQMNIELQIGYQILYEDDASAPDFAKTSKCPNKQQTPDDSMVSALANWTKHWRERIRGNTSIPAVATNHLMTGCGGKGIMGIAFRGTLCSSIQPTGINKIWMDKDHDEWSTFAHELGHNFGAQHSFEDGRLETGGIMDYGDGLLNGVYQFNTKYRKTEMCDRLTTQKTLKCKNQEFEPKVPPLPKHVADWKKSFNKKGWSEADGPIVGIFRNSCNLLYCIDEVKYVKVPLDLERCSTEELNFQNNRMKVCPEGKFLKGIWRKPCDRLTCIKKVKCCSQAGHDAYAGSCTDADWSSSFNREGYSYCPEYHAIVGLKKESCDELYCLKEVKCCPYNPLPTPALG